MSYGNKLIKPSNSNGFLSLNDFYNLGKNYINLFLNDRLWRIWEIIDLFNESKRKGAEVYVETSRVPIEFDYTLYIVNHLRQFYHLSNIDDSRSVDIESYFNMVRIRYTGTTMTNTILVFSDKYSHNYYVYNRQFDYHLLFNNSEKYGIRLDIDSCVKTTDERYIENHFLP